MLLKQTKIVASISDRRCDVDFIKQLFEAGMNVVRMNTAHASREGFEALIANVRAVSNRIAMTLDDLVKGDDCMFTATAITNCNMLNGLRYFGDGVRTHTISARYKTGTVRFVDAIHSLDRKVLAVKL